jgi:hypothetical protein
VGRDSVALPGPTIPTAIDDVQLNLGFPEIAAPASHQWQELPAEQRAAAVTTLARLIAKTMNHPEEDDRG